ncbi:hypothetical protein, partial [Candidatus Ulvibacter alkanivorans]|uniref:hypothetical protein n=1 Tax=Candidatus Ulvibacter alkanivorans TaxID=2267620 RepID=UPI00109C1939
MKKSLRIILIFWVSLGYSQDSQELIDFIVNKNSFHSDCVGSACEESELYRKWVLLKSKLTDEELIELSKNEEAVLRAYSIRELIANEKYPATELLKFELSKSESVESYDGCLIDIDELASIVYHEYWNKIRIESLKDVSDSEKERNEAMSRILRTDPQMEKLDSLIIYANEPQNFVIYRRVFTNRIHK